MTPRNFREDFPILKREVHPSVPLVYLDSAATSQKPETVLAAMDEYYRRNNANIHRGVHVLAEEATRAYEDAREKIARFINAEKSREIIYTRNTTEAINLVAYSWGRAFLKKGDLVVLTEMEHHSNLVPWYILAEQTGIELAHVAVTGDGLLDPDDYASKLARFPKVVAFTHMSNVLGTINPVAEMAAAARKAGAITLVDGAQAVPHMPVDVQALGVDFYAFSGHKMCGPTGIGILYGREELLKAMPPFLGGGDMIKRVELGRFVANELPYKFEAGTPAIAEAIGLGAAVDYLSVIGMDVIHEHEKALIHYAIDRLEEVPGVKVFGPSADKKGGVAAFTFDGVHPHDVAEILDRRGIAVRAGHHCAMPLHQKFDIPATARASFYLYNEKAEIDLLIEGLYEVKKTFHS
ncbi:MAG: cysteine desulfurase [Anaerolineae bacterium]|nr:MAG: cysteine desulfurase [Anaerolineae bacterium]